MLNTAPLVTTARAPNRSVSRPAMGPKSPADATARDPTHAEREI